ncbi:MAG: hypothetical protein HY869_15095 [Chloroflexi bacterium]|nr:hypothetical protein [Chloroflexota bacterium]
MNSKLKKNIALIAVNILFSWMILPLLIPPFQLYSPAQLIEVLFWQGVGTVGWPLALAGGFLNFLLQSSVDGLGNLLIVLVYPALLVLFIRVWMAKYWWWEIVLLHVLVTLSFAAVWVQVLNGYDFMVG